MEMSTEMMNTVFGNILIGCLIFLAMLVLISVIRSILGPKTTDRIIAVNMIGTMVIVMFVIFTVYLNEDYLADVALIYAMISFLAVVVLTKVFTGIYRIRNQEKEQQAEQTPTVGQTGEQSPDAAAAMDHADMQPAEEVRL